MEDLQHTPINDENLWRLETPGAEGWDRTARAGAANKYFMVSTDCHANEPPDLWATQLPEQYRERAPRIVTDEQGVQWRYCEGYRPDRAPSTPCADGGMRMRPRRACHRRLGVRMGLLSAGPTGRATASAPASSAAGMSVTPGATSRGILAPFMGLKRGENDPPSRVLAAPETPMVPGVRLPPLPAVLMTRTV